MKLKPLGRVALLACVSIAMVCGLTSCATNTLGYLYVTTGEYGQVASLRLDINTGQIKSVTCNTGNGDQSNCITSAGGSYATKMVLAAGNTLAYVLNTTYSGNPASISLLTLGASGSVFNTGETYTSYGQDPVDIYLNPTGQYLYVLDQYQPADIPGCANPTPTTCGGDITVFAIDGKGDLSPVICGTGDTCLKGVGQYDSYVFPVNYEPGPLNPGYGGDRMLALNNVLYVLDEVTPDTSPTNLGTPEVNTFTISASTGQLQANLNEVTHNSGFVQLSSIIAGVHVYISDYQTGQIWIYSPNGTGGLTPAANQFVCPSNLVQPGTSCKENPGSNANQTVALDAMISAGTYLYAADYANNTVFAMNDTSAGTFLVATTGGNNTPFGTNTTCLTLSSGPEFLYGAGTGTVIGYQINTSTGGLSTNLNPTTGVPFTGVVPCVEFTPRT